LKRFSRAATLREMVKIWRHSASALLSMAWMAWRTCWSSAASVKEQYCVP
jgi:hypothetical protein